MLTIAKCFEDLDFPALMRLYREGNKENGAVFYPQEAPETRLALAERDFRAYLLEDFFSKSGVRYCIWEEHTVYLSALRLEPFDNGLLLEALETHPDHRLRGHAKALILAVLAKLPQGTRIYSHVDKENTPSLATHLRCGFSILHDYTVQSGGERCDYEYTLFITV